MKAGRLPERAFVSPSDILWSGLAVGGKEAEMGRESDSDDDGLTDSYEINYPYEIFTDPNDSDSDDDGLSDGDEVYGLNNTYGYNSDPNESDSDDDGITDSTEVNNCIYGEANDECTDPEDTDSDGFCIELSTLYEFSLANEIINSLF